MTVSDSIGPGAPDIVEVRALSNAGFAENRILTASDIGIGLNGNQVSTAGNRTAYLNFLHQAVEAINAGDIAAAVDKLQKALERTDGCALRGTPDGNGPGRDWITDCAQQTELYRLLTEALNALTP